MVIAVRMSAVSVPNAKKPKKVINATATNASPRKTPPFTHPSAGYFPKNNQPHNRGSSTLSASPINTHQNTRHPILLSCSAEMSTRLLPCSHPRTAYTNNRSCAAFRGASAWGDTATANSSATRLVAPSPSEGEYTSAGGAGWQSPVTTFAGRRQSCHGTRGGILAASLKVRAARVSMQADVRLRGRDRKLGGAGLTPASSTTKSM